MSSRLKVWADVDVTCLKLPVSLKSIYIFWYVFISEALICQRNSNYGWLTLTHHHPPPPPHTFPAAHLVTSWYDFTDMNFSLSFIALPQSTWISIHLCWTAAKQLPANNQPPSAPNHHYWKSDTDSGTFWGAWIQSNFENQQWCQTTTHPLWEYSYFIFLSVFKAWDKLSAHKAITLMASANVPNCLHQHHKDQTQEKKKTRITYRSLSPSMCTWPLNRNNLMV